MCSGIGPFPGSSNTFHIGAPVARSSFATAQRRTAVLVVSNTGPVMYTPVASTAIALGRACQYVYSRSTRHVSVGGSDEVGCAPGEVTTSGDGADDRDGVVWLQPTTHASDIPSTHRALGRI